MNTRLKLFLTLNVIIFTICCNDFTNSYSEVDFISKDGDLTGVWRITQESKNSLLQWEVAKKPENINLSLTKNKKFQLIDIPDCSFVVSIDCNKQISIDGRWELKLLEKAKPTLWLISNDLEGREEIHSMSIKKKNEKLIIMIPLGDNHPAVFLERDEIF